MDDPTHHSFSWNIAGCPPDAAESLLTVQAHSTVILPLSCKNCLSAVDNLEWLPTPQILTKNIRWHILEQEILGSFAGVFGCGWCAFVSRFSRGENPNTLFIFPLPLQMHVQSFMHMVNTQTLPRVIERETEREEVREEENKCFYAFRYLASVLSGVEQCIVHNEMGTTQTE